jgi:hypothetical protein
MTDYDSLLDQASSSLNKYDTLLGGSDTDPRAASARQGVASAVLSGVDADAYAAAAKVAAKTGLPVNTIMGQPAEVAKQTQVGSIDFNDLAQTAPATADLLSDYQKAMISHDDVDNLSGIEKALAPVARVSRAVGAGMYDVATAWPGMAEVAVKNIAPVLDWTEGTLLPENPLRRVAAGLEDWRKKSQQVSENIQGDISKAGPVEKDVISGFRSVGQMALPLAGAIATGNPAIAVGAGAALQGEQSATQALDKGATPFTALTLGLADAEAEAVTEALPVGRLVKDVKAGAPLWKLIGNQIMREVPTEMAATAWQNFDQWALINKDKPFSDYLNELPDAEKSTVISTITSTIATAGLGHGINRVFGQAEMRRQQAQDAGQSAEALQAVTDLAKQSKTLARDPDAFKSFIGQIAQGTPVETVYIDADKLAQSGFLDKLSEVSPAVREQYQGAVTSGGMVAIPLDEYATSIAPTDMGAALMQDLRTDPNGMSMSEQQEYLKDGGREALRADLQTAVDAQMQTDAFKQSADSVRKSILDQLNSAGRFDKDVNEQYATLSGSFYNVMAARMGMTPEEYFKTNPLTITDQVPAGETAADVRGQFVPATNTLRLLEKADLSTYIHESGHFFLNSFTKLIDSENLPTDIKEDIDSVMKWFGVPSAQEWNAMPIDQQREYHEKFARGFEAYAFEGKAPSIELQRTFQTFRSWMLNVYRALVAAVRGSSNKVGTAKPAEIAKTLNVELSDEVRAVFDRMLASADEIQTAEQMRGMQPLITDPAALGMSREEYLAYHKESLAASMDATQELETKSLRDLQWFHNAQGREVKRLQRESDSKRKALRTQIQKDVMSRPVYQAYKYLTGRNHIKDPANAGRFLESDITKQYPEAISATLKNRGMLSPKGISPDLIAEKFGFTSGDALVRQLAAANDMNGEIEGLTDAAMLSQYSELATPEGIDREADKAVHNTLRAKVLTTEANALAKAVGQRKVVYAAAKEYAAQIVARNPIRLMRPSQYTAAEARAAKAAAQAYNKGDLKAAATEKRNQLINNLVAKEVFKAQEEAKKVDQYFRKIADLPDDKVGKTRDMDIVNAVRGVLAQYGYGARKAKTAAEYLDRVKENDPETFAIVAQSVATAEATAKSVNDMTMEELRGLRDEIDSMWFMAKRSRQMEVDGDLLDRQDAADQLHERMQEIGIPEQIGTDQAVTKRQEALMNFMSLIACGRRVESWVGLKDGQQLTGPFRRYIFNPIKDAADKYRVDKQTKLKEFRDVVASVQDSFKREIIDAPELGYTFGKDGSGVAMNEILHAILHTGNDSNMRKMLLGRGWASENADGSLNTKNWNSFIQRMVSEGKITKEHFDFAQKIWDLLESMKPAAQAAHRVAFGKYFAEVTAREFDTPFGKYRGGYVPAQVDSRIVKDMELKKLIEEGKENMSYAFPSTSKGFTKARVEYNRPLMLDIRSLSQHIDKVLLFSHMEVPVRDAGKLLRMKDVSSPLNRIDPAAINAMLIPWLQRSASQTVSIPVIGVPWANRFIGAIRNRTSMAAMMGNLSNAVQQVAGFLIAGVRVRPSLLLSATADYIRSPKEMAQQVSGMSTYMAHRMDAEVGAMMDDIDQILLNPNLYQKAKAWTARHVYFLQTAVDNVMGPIIWKGAYNHAAEQGLSHEDAVRFADSTIRETQGSSLPEDVSRLETGPAYLRLFTQFAGYFNMQANLLGTEFGKVMQDGGMRKGMGKGLYVFMAGFYAPAIVAELIAQAFRGGPGDADKDGEYLDDWLMATLAYGPLRNVTAFVPFVGQAVNATVGAFTGSPTDDRMSLSPAVSMIESSAKSAADLYHSVTKENTNIRGSVRDVGSLISLTTGLPASVAARPVGYVSGVAQGKIAPTGAVDLSRGLITGVPSPESKRP